MSDSTDSFRSLMDDLPPIWRAIESGRPCRYTTVVVPSLSFDPAELTKIQGISFYEERLLFSLIRLRDPRATVIYLTSQPIHPEIVDYYLDLLRGVSARDARSRLHLLSLNDPSPIPLTRKILDRPRVVARLRAELRDAEHAYLSCFNATPLERDLALALGIPLNGLDPELLPLGSKSGSREIFRQAGIDLPHGYENLRHRRDLVAALAQLAEERPQAARAVVKLNDSFAGAGNALFTFPEGDGRSDPDRIDARLDALEWTTPDETLDNYLAQMTAMGGIVEEFVEANEVRSPSVQLRITPDGEIVLISTHDQILGGATQQTYLGCRFPADSAYRRSIQERGLAVAEVLRERGVTSRFGVDFLVVRDAGEPWRALAIEINLRMGGTTAPYLALQFLTKGRLDPASGRFVSGRGVEKYYWATDNLTSPAYRGLLPEDFMEIMAAHHLYFDGTTETGAIFHMIGALSQFGKVGVTSIGDSREEAEQIYGRVVEALDREGRRTDVDPARIAHPFETAVHYLE
ncbi:MAG: peptide ligase PGM1-related protein [Thermoanaerobaculia bacterium]|nr:peptide ligase PGM1-related protein [Thermoanaerobaculia bacterium]